MKKIVEIIKDVRKNPKGQAFLFFGFYFFFFIVVIIYARNIRIESKKYDSTEFERGDPMDFSINGLNLDNYSFQYKVILDGETHEYLGKKNQDEIFQYQGKEYYHHGDLYYVKDDKWVKSVNPYLFSDFLNEDNLYSLISNSFYESKTSYDSGKETFNLLISTNTINQVLHKIDSDFLENPNKLVISTNEKKDLNQIHLYLNSYCTLNKLCKSSLEILFYWDDVGSIEEIKNPVLGNSE